MFQRYKEIEFFNKFLESNNGPQMGNGTYKGVGFLGSFNKSGTVSSVGSGAYLYEAVYFHENGCYSDGREYGFFLDVPSGHVYAYWEAHANASGDTQNKIDLGTGFTNGTYYFSIWPQTTSGTGNGCQFNVSVKNTFLNEVWGGGPYDVDYGSVNVTGADSGFCSAIVSETGYVTAGTVYNPTISTISDTSNIKLSLSRVYVGK